MKIDIDLHSGQAEIYDDLFLSHTTRHAVAACSRGWGKSYLATNCAVSACSELMQMPPDIPNKNVAIIAPTYSQVMDIYMPLLKDTFGMGSIARKIIKDEGKFELPNNVTLKLWSFEAIERMRGTGQYFVVNDELCSWTSKPGIKGAWEDIIEPCISTRWSPKMAEMYGSPSAGRSLSISTVKGYDYFYEMFNMYELDNDFCSYRYTFKDSPYLDVEEINKKRERMDPLTFAREYLADFAESGNSVFYRFDRSKHVANVPEVEDWEDIHVAIDFNVGIQASSIFVVRGDQVHFVDELSGHPDTESLARALNGRWSSTYVDDNGIIHRRKIYAYPDPTGKSRKTSAPVGVTDFTILRDNNIIVCVRNSSPSIVDSVAAVNSMLESATGKIRTYISPSCKGLISSLERTVWLDNNPNTASISKKEQVEHFSDGVRYAFEYLFPVINRNVSVRKGNKF